MSLNNNLPNKDVQSLRLSSSFSTSEKRSSNEPKYDVNIKSLSIKQKINLELFDFEVSKLKFCPIGSSENISGNYDNYLYETLTHIAQMKNVKFNYALESPSIYENYPYEIIESLSLSNKKILILDLDETLIHADFDEEFLDEKLNKYDAIIKFKTKKQDIEETYGDNDSTWCSTAEEEDDVHSVGIFVRNGVQEFLKEVNKYFYVGIFTASVKEYADAVISFLDPENKLIKFRLYRNNCINFNDSFTIKDLRIFKNIDLSKIILIDNSMYSFAAQINNGILINSFFNDKNDSELINALEYLINYIYPADDVRKVNEEFFNFRQIINDLNGCK